MPTQKNSASWDLQLGFNLAFKRLTEDLNMKHVRKIPYPVDKIKKTIFECLLCFKGTSWK